LVEGGGGAGWLRSALLIGALDRIEVWDPERFAAAAPDPGQESEELEAAVYEIFG